MQVLTISIDGRTRADLVQALAEVTANLAAGIDAASFENEHLSLRYTIRQYELPPPPVTEENAQSAALKADFWPRYFNE